VRERKVNPELFEQVDGDAYGIMLFLGQSLPPLQELVCGDDLAGVGGIWRS
jgi:hypothetical protein